MHAPRSRELALALSFLWPGAGQWYLGHRRPALVYALPPLVILLVIAYQVATGFESFALSLLDPSVSLTILALVVFVGVWRLLSMADTLLPFEPRPGHGVRMSVLAVTLGVVAIASHLAVGYYAWSFYDAGSRIFVGGTDRDPSPTPAPSSTPGWDDGFVVEPFETPKADQGRITILLTGIDKNEDRTHSLTDTLLLVSLDPVAKTVAMVSLPRDVAEFPLWDGRQYQGKINSFLTYATNHPAEYPEGGLASLAREVSFLVGVPINYYAAVDLDGFTRLIDAAGGVDVTVSRAITDGFYDWLDGSPRGFFLSQGTHHLDGRTALAYVRSRYGTGDSDFTRAARQQQLLLALRSNLKDPAMIARLPDVLKAAADMIRTNFPNDRLDAMLALARVLGDDGITRIVLQPPTYAVHPPTSSTNATYILRLKLDAVARLSVDLFGEDSRYWTGVALSPSASPAPGASVTP